MAEGQRAQGGAGITPTATSLKPAAKLGMTTVLVGPHAAASDADFVHYRTERLAPFLAAARVKETR